MKKTLLIPNIAVIAATPLISLTCCNDEEKPLNDYTWKEISEISASGKASTTFHIGDEKTVKINGLTHSVRIIGFNHDEDANGNKLGITFEFKHLITNLDKTFVGTIWALNFNYDYKEYSYIDSFLNDEGDYRSIINLLPNDLVDVIKPAKKWAGHTDDQGETWTTSSFEAKLWPLAHDEMTQTESIYVVPNEGTTYEYYKQHDTNEDRRKFEAEVIDGSAWDYWTRSPCELNMSLTGSCAFSVNEGNPTMLSAINGFDWGVAPGFCI